MPRKNDPSQAGFTLLELLVSVALMSTLCGAVVLCLGTAQKSYRRSEITNALNQQLRSALQLMTQDISQAGLTGTDYSTTTTNTAYMSLTGNDNPTPLATLTQSVNSSNTTATVSSTAGIFIGQTLLVGVGANQESIYISGVNASTSTITTVFGNGTGPQGSSTTHSIGDPLYPNGVFGDGVVPTNEAVGPSTINTLHLYGNLTGNGTITVVDYVCPTSSTTPQYVDSTGTVWAPLVRYEYDNALAQGSSPVPNTKVNILDLVAVTPGGCFTPTNASQPVNALSADNSPTFVTAMSITIRAMAGVLNSNGTVSPEYDPDTHQPVTVTRSFLNIQPRNINAAYQFANYCNQKGLPDGELMSMPPQIASMIGAIP
jgi:prepilin-type N-terminal cleavage/methylation domain-containing protein